MQGGIKTPDNDWFDAYLQHLSAFAAVGSANQPQIN
jgi:hypothetical protein